MPAPVVAAAAAGGGGAGGGAAGAAGGAGGMSGAGGSAGQLAQFGKGGQMLGKKGISKKDMVDQAQQQDFDLDSARSEMKQPPMPGLELGKSLSKPISKLKKGMQIGSKSPEIGGMG